MDTWSRWALIVRSHYMLQHGMRATEDFVSHELEFVREVCMALWVVLPAETSAEKMLALEQCIDAATTMRYVDLNDPQKIKTALRPRSPRRHEVPYDLKTERGRKYFQDCIIKVAEAFVPGSAEVDLNLALVHDMAATWVADAGKPMTDVEAVKARLQACQLNTLD